MDKQKEVHFTVQQRWVQEFYVQEIKRIADKALTEAGMDEDDYNMLLHATKNLAKQNGYTQHDNLTLIQGGLCKSLKA